jgi:PAS domain S-box-containing protein
MKSRPDKYPDELQPRALARQPQERLDQLALAPDGVRSLVAELRTHQIELEIQNEELRRAQSELATSRDRFSDLYDFAPLGYATVGANGLIVEANLTLAEMLHVGRGKIINQRFSAFIHPDDAGIYYRHRKNTLAGEKRQTCRLRLQRSAEANFWAELDSLSIGPPVDHETVVRHAIRDITDYRKIEATLHQSQRLESIGTMVSGLAHNMNNILQGVIGHTQLVAESIDADSPQHADLDRALQAAKRGATLVRQLLTFGRPDPATVRNVDLRTLVAETAGLLRSIIPPHTMIVENVDSACGTVAGNAAELQQVVFNLCTNAQQALADGCGEIRIGLKEVGLPLADGSRPVDLPGGRYACLTVSDEGTGMTTETLQRACEPFFSTKPLFAGTGLGLFTVHGIVAGHGGAMQIISQPRLGTEVLIYLPCALAAAATDEMRWATVWHRRAKPRIMFVDDEPLITGLVKRQLERKNYEVETFQSSQAALAAFAADPGAFDLLISDQSMPEMKGTQLATRITALRPGLPVILMSGLMEPLGETDKAQTGIVRFLAKPVETPELEQAILEVMESAADADRGD